MAKYICDEREGNRILEGRIAGSGRGSPAPDLDLRDEFALVAEGRHQWFLTGRKGQDPTMHLVVSFTPEESDSLRDEDYWKIERQVLEGIGLEDHRRISVVHDDTGNRHMHIAVDLLDERGAISRPVAVEAAAERVPAEDLCRARMGVPRWKQAGRSGSA